MKFGDHGTDVTNLQLKLKAVGYPLKGTGYFGPATLASVEDFQRTHHLMVTGTVDEDLIEKIQSGEKPETVNIEVSRPLWLTISLSHVGLKEGAGVKDNPELIKDIQEVSKDYFYDSTPWCAGWVSYCLLHAGVQPSPHPLWALSYSLGWGPKLHGPALGSIAVKHRAGGGHVTLVAGRTSSGKLACCGGNQGDMVSVVGYPASVFDGFFWPPSIELPSETRFEKLPLVNGVGKVQNEA